MEWPLIFFYLLGMSIVHGRGFHFPDEVESKAQSNSDAWHNGFSNLYVNANTNTNTNKSPLSEYEDHSYDGYGYPNFANRYPNQGLRPQYKRPVQPYNSNSYPSLSSSSHANAQSNSQNLGGRSLSNALAGSQSHNGNDGISAAAAAASAGTSFVNGIPVASAAVATAAAVASPHGVGVSLAASTATASGDFRYPGLQHLGLNYEGLYDNNYDYPQRQRWLYRNGGDYNLKKFDIVDAIDKGVDSIIFED